MENITREKLELWAGYLLDYSLNGVEKDEIIMIKGEPITWHLITVLQDLIIQRGGIPDINLVPPDNDRGKVWGAAMAKYGSEHQIKQVPDWQLKRYENMTKYIEILGAENPKLFEGVDPKLHQAIMRADSPIKDTRLSKPWVLTLFPTQGFAEMEGLSLEEYTKVIVDASTVNPVYLEEVEEDIYRLLNKSKTFRAVTVHPDDNRELTLTMDISGRDVVKCTGKRNFPDGEVFTSPNSNTVNGEIFVDLPVFQGGGTIQGIYLKFEEGEIVNYNAKVGNEFLTKIIETDFGSKRLGEVALGMNNGISKVLKHPLFVEKIGGTMHIAIGASYPECYASDERSNEELLESGLLNKSAQHVDIVTDFRTGGSGKAVFLDNIKLEIENNIWKVPVNG